MYAVIADGGHQYKVEEGLVFEVQIRDLPEDATTVEFDRILLVGNVEGGPKIGRPIVEGAKVSASIIREMKGDKIVIRKFRRRKNYMRKQGHRQNYLQLKVEKIHA